MEKEFVKRLRAGLGIIFFLVGGMPRTAYADQVDILLKKLVEKQVITQQESDEIRNDTREEFKKDVKKASPEWVNKLKFSGDMRLRHEYFDRTAATDRSRERIRLRLGMEAGVSDELKAGVRLATGTNLDPVSTNQSFQDTFDKKDFFVDQAFLEYTPKGYGLNDWGVKVLGGKFDSPFYYTPLVWDGDLTPEGIAFQVTPKGWGAFEPFATGGIFPIDEISGSSDDPTLYGAQVGTGWSPFPDHSNEFLRKLKLKGAVGYYDYTHLKAGIDADGVTATAFGNTLTSSVTTSTITYNGDYNELDLAGEIGSVIPGTLPLLSGQPFKIQGDAVQNVALGRGRKSQGWQFGGKIGKADKPLAWEAGYFYQWLEADAVIGRFTDSDFGDVGGTNRFGNVASFTIGTLKDSTLGAKYFAVDSIKGAKADTGRLQVDWITKF